MVRSIFSLLVTITFSVSLVVATCANAADLRSPWPDAAAVKKAQTEVREIYAGDFDRAKSSAEKAKLARELLDAADKIGDDTAQRLVLLSLAKSLAIEGKDRKTAMDAAQAIAERYKPIEELPKAKELIDRGDKSLAAAKREQAAVKKLELQVEAFECYLWAKTTATGLAKQLCEKRLAELMADAAEGKRNGKADDLKLLIGAWAVSAGGTPVTWKFMDDGEVVHPSNIAAKWTAERDVVKVTWANGALDTFTRPINAKSTSGYSWRDKIPLRAVKIK